MRSNIGNTIEISSKFLDLRLRVYTPISFSTSSEIYPSTNEKQKVVRQLEYRQILRLTSSSPSPCLNCLMTRLLVVSPCSSISQISIIPLYNPRAIRFAEIHSTTLMTSSPSNVWKRFSFVASPFARVSHNNNFFSSWIWEFKKKEEMKRWLNKSRLSASKKDSYIQKENFKWERGGERKRKRSWHNRFINLFTTFFPSSNKKIRNRQIEQIIQCVSYLKKSSKNVLSEWIPFDFTRRISLHSKEDFPAGI